MPRLKAVTGQDADRKTQQTFDGIEKKLGKVPNVIRTMANAPPVLDAYLAFSSAMAGGSLPAKLREQIALAVAEANRCDYCLAAHATLGAAAGLTDAEIADSRRALSPDSRTEAALNFARKVVADRARVSDDDVARLRGAGLNDGAITEIIGHVVLNLFTNYVNHVAETEIDFPEPQAVEAAPACAC